MHHCAFTQEVYSQKCLERSKRAIIERLKHSIYALKSPNQTLIFQSAYSMSGTVIILAHSQNNPMEVGSIIISTFINEETKRCCQLECEGDLAGDICHPIDHQGCWFSWSGWLGRCPLLPSLFHVHPSWSCALGLKGEPSPMEERTILWSSVYE